MKTQRTSRCRHLVVLGLLTLGTAATAFADYSSTVLAKNPVGYWRFDQTNQPPPPAVATNYGSAGSAADGLYINGVKQLVADAMPATSDTAPAFDGFSQKVQVPFNAALNPSGAFTVEAWVQPMLVDGFDNRWFRAVCRSGTQQDGGGYQIQFDTGTPVGAPQPGVFKFTMWNATSSKEVFLPLTAPGNILATNNGPWAHLVGTWSSSDNIGRIYVNGVELTNVTYVYAPNTNAPLRIGAGDIGPTDPWGQSFDPGPICKVALYDTQLTPSQIAAHYANGTNIAPATPYSSLIASDNPVGYWPLNESNIPAQPVLTNLGSAGAALNGAYGYNSTPGVSGAQAPNYGGLGASNSAAYLAIPAGSAWVPPVNLASNNTLTVTAWIKRDGSQQGAATIFGRRIPGGEKSAFCFDGGGLNKLSYNWDDNANQYNFDTKLTVPDGMWTLAAMVITPSNAVIYMDYGAGLQAATNNYTNITLVGFTHEILMGPSGPYAGRQFKGSIDEVAVWTNALTASDLWDLRTAAFGSGLFMSGISDGRPVMLGGVAPFTCIAGAGSDYLPLSYQLLKDGAPVGAPGNSATITLSNITAADVSGAFSIGVITNGGSMVLTSGVTSLTRWTIPGTYSALVESLQPAAYYRFSETNGTTVYELAKAADARLFNSAIRTNGPVPVSQAGFETSNTGYRIGPGVGYISSGTPVINTNTVTITAWVYPYSAQSDRGIYFSRGSQYAGFGFGNGGNQLDVTWWNGQFYVGSQVFVFPNMWSFVAVTVTGTNATFYRYDDLNGWTNRTVTRTFSVPNLAGANTGIGNDPFDQNARALNGQLDEVAVFNRVLTPEQIYALGDAGIRVHMAIEPAPNNACNVGWSYGTLESATDILGPWTPVSGAVPPAYVGPTTNAQQFFRVVP